MLFNICFQFQEPSPSVVINDTSLKTLYITNTRSLQNAKVMAREKQGEAAQKVMFMKRIH